MFPEESNLGIFQPIIGSWYESIENPEESQRRVLSDLVKGYEKTRYGKNHHASKIEEITDFSANFPIIDYRKLNPYLAEVQKGDYSVILPEPLVCWVMTRGSTGPAKVLPATKTHLEQIFTCGARALVNYVLREKGFELLTGKILNLNFPSNVHTTITNGQTITYGYSSGTYARLNPMFDKVSLLPKQEEIDALGPGISKADWERRFEMAYQRALNENVTAAMGVTPVILSFGRYIKKKHGKKPEELWNFRALFCTSVRKIQFKYAPVLRRYFGQVPVVEIYSATEGVFAQQLDDLPYVTPNYDEYFFEVKTGRGTKMLHQLKRGEWGRLIVSSCMFPRYDIGDLIEAAGKNYFRVIGRNRLPTLLEHRLFRSLFRWFL
ncbi:MAG: GH3 auxin-responsive promoter family protein [Candidatus Methylarchaceae archaeon HK02M1]|nr:GH3 auxin-responsive promoter family protein [Candidatus Methylarchaceae archaeon HK01M]MCP8311665.1 GH3 auxin-responsive promoter family protein [Candidatus Methylarchaceae archaeon HK02M1]